VIAKSFLFFTLVTGAVWAWFTFCIYYGVRG